MNFLVRNIFQVTSQHQPVHQECWEFAGVTVKVQKGSVSVEPWGCRGWACPGRSIGLTEHLLGSVPPGEDRNIFGGSWCYLWLLIHFSLSLEAFALRCTLIVTEHEAARGAWVVAAWWVKIPVVLIANSILPFSSCKKVIGQVMALKENLHPSKNSLTVWLQNKRPCTRHCFGDKAKGLVLPTSVLLGLYREYKGLFLFLQLFVLEDLCFTIHLFFLLCSVLSVLSQFKWVRRTPPLVAFPLSRNVYMYT